MNILKNRHVLVAALVAPVLALMSYFAMDYLFGERPQAAREGQSYPLAERSNCRYASGSCGLRNADFALDLTASSGGSGGLVLHLTSAFPLDGVKVALAPSGTDPSSPRDMQAKDGQRLNWETELPQPDPERDRLHLVASAGGVLYFGDAATRWTAPGDSGAQEDR